MARCGEERGGHAPCFMNGLVALGGGRRGDASGFTLGWIGNVAVSVSAVVVREDIFFVILPLKSIITIPTNIQQSNSKIA